MKPKLRRLTTVLPLVAAVSVPAVLTSPLPVAANTGAVGPDPSGAVFGTMSDLTTRPGPNADTIPFWSSSFTYNGVTYPYSQVGTDPHAGPATTVVPVEIQPLRFVLADGEVFDATPDAASAVASPIFQPAPFVSGNTQYGDALQRAEYWTVGGSGNYHVLLAAPKVLPTIEIHIPPRLAYTYTGSVSGGYYLAVTGTWLDGQIRNLIGSGSFTPSALPIILDHQTVALQRGGYFLGSHGAFSAAAHGTGDQPIQTSIYSTWMTRTTPDNLNADVLSHEVSEWLNDPFTNNTVPLTQTAVQGCLNLLEVGDPLDSQTQIVNGYTLQDEAFESWFARQVPSVGLGGLYSLFGNFTTVAPSC